MIKISVVVPVYNVEKYLRPCLECAKKQTLKEIEIICVDDGSTDSSGKILDEYAAQDSRFVVIHKENGGYGKAMNVGLEHAQGKYFCILESDDLIMPDTYEILYNAAEEYEADIVRTDYFDLTTKNGKINLVAKQLSTDYSYYYRTICPNREPIVYSFVMHNWTGIYRREFIEKHNIRYNETPGASYQDNGFFFQVFSQTEKLVYVPRPCYCYRIDNPQSSIHDKSKIYTMANEYVFIRNFLANHPEFEQAVLPAYYARLFRAHYQTYIRIASEHKREYCELIRKDMLDAKEQHLLDTGLFLERERVLLMYILESVDTFMLATGPKSIKKILFLAKRQIKECGVKYFFKTIKSKLSV